MSGSLSAPEDRAVKKPWPLKLVIKCSISPAGFAEALGNAVLSVTTSPLSVEENFITRFLWTQLYSSLYTEIKRPDGGEIPFFKEHGF